MKSCTDIDRSMTAYVDGELPSSQRRAVDAHLEACAPCRERSRIEQAARALVRRHAATLVPPAPAGLQARCRAATPAAAMAASAAPSRWRWRSSWSIAAAAVLVIAAAVTFLRLSGQSGPVVAAELALDHAKCFALTDVDAKPAELATLEQSFEQTYGWRAGIPSGLLAPGVELLEARRCAYHSGQMAHILCRLDGQPMSLFVLPQGVGRNAEMRSVGQQVVIWGGNERTYALVGEQATPELRRVASAIQRGTVTVP